MITRTILQALQRIEEAVASFAYITVAALLISDVLGRELFGTSFLGAQKLAIYAASCALFAAISGSSPVTLLAVGAILYPALIENGYSKRFALGAITLGGTLGIIIPPSIPLIVYGLVTEQSIADLFIAGIGPGILLTIALAGYALWVNRKRPARPFQRREFLRALRDGIWALLLPVVLLGGIYSGYFSPTEAAAVGLAYGLLVEMFIHRELTLADFHRTIIDAAKMLGMPSWSYPRPPSPMPHGWHWAIWRAVWWRCARPWVVWDRLQAGRCWSGNRPRLPPMTGCSPASSPR